jgi:hypothetical protein
MRLLLKACETAFIRLKFESLVGWEGRFTPAQGSTSSTLGFFTQYSGVNGIYSFE